MAEGTKLVLTFNCEGGKEGTFSYKYAKPAATSTQVKAAAQAMIANGEIFETRPLEIKSAKMVTTSETVFDLADLTRETPYPYKEALARGLIDEEDTSFSDN